jgi:hypothetical protein
MIAMPVTTRRFPAAAGCRVLSTKPARRARPRLTTSQSSGTLISAPQDKDVEDRLVLQHRDPPEVDLAAAHEGERLASLEVAAHSPLRAPEDGDHVHGGTAVSPGHRRPGGERLPGDARADEEEHDRRDPREGEQAEVQGEKRRSQHDQQERPGALARVSEQLRDSDRDQGERPPPEDLAGVGEAEAVEGEEKARQHDGEADHEAGGDPEVRGRLLGVHRGVHRLPPLITYGQRGVSGSGESAKPRPPPADAGSFGPRMP